MEGAEMPPYNFQDLRRSEGTFLVLLSIHSRVAQRRMGTPRQPRPCTFTPRPRRAPRGRRQAHGRPVLRKGEKKIPGNNEFVYDYDEAPEEAIKLFGASAIVRGTELGV